MKFVHNSFESGNILSQIEYKINPHTFFHLCFLFKLSFFITYDRYRITTALKVETDIIASIEPSLIGRAVILVTMYVERFKKKLLTLLEGKLLFQKIF